MRHIKIALLLGAILIGITIGVQADSGVVHTYEQTAKKKYIAFEDVMTEKFSDFHQTSENSKAQAFKQIEVEIATEFGTSRDQVRKMIVDYKQNYIVAIESETEQLKNGMYEDYAKEKQEIIQEEITEDISTFLDDLLSE